MGVDTKFLLLIRSTSLNYQLLWLNSHYVPLNRKCYTVLSFSDQHCVIAFQNSRHRCYYQKVSCQALKILFLLVSNGINLLERNRLIKWILCFLTDCLQRIPYLKQ
ncbi:hypothetical protein P9112_010124 [Eukaryota sp. TZLM1-RC]